MPERRLDREMDPPHVGHRVPREDRVPVEIADVRTEHVRHGKPLGEHGERVVLLVDHPSPHDLLEDEDIRRFVRDHLDERVERRDLAGVEPLVDVVGHHRERVPRVGDRRRPRREHEREQRHRDGDRNEGDRQGAPRRNGPPGDGQRGDGDDRRPDPCRGRIRPEGVEAEGRREEEKPPDRESERNDDGRPARRERRGRQAGAGEHHAACEHESAGE